TCFFCHIRCPPRPTLFPTRRSSDLHDRRTHAGLSLAGDVARGRRDGCGRRVVHLHGPGMTSITLDDATLGDVGGATCVADVVTSVRDRLRREDRIITGLSCDGVELVGDGIEAALAMPRDQVAELEIQSQRLGQIVLSLLRQAGEMLIEARALREPIADMLAEGRAVDAMKALGSFIRTWVQTLAVVEQCAAALGVDLTQDG